jgi:hypothetical protein
MELPDDIEPTPEEFVEMHRQELPIKVVSCPTVPPQSNDKSAAGNYFIVLNPGETVDMFSTAANGGWSSPLRNKLHLLHVSGD